MAINPNQNNQIGAMMCIIPFLIVFKKAISRIQILGFRKNSNQNKMNKPPLWEKKFESNLVPYTIENIFAEWTQYQDIGVFCGICHIGALAEQTVIIEYCTADAKRRMLLQIFLGIA